MLTGVDHGLEVFGLVETHKSSLPSVPVRFEARYSSRPSRRGDGDASLPLLLSAGTKTAGAKVPSFPITLE
jgi:hypothetical protein